MQSSETTWRSIPAGVSEALLRGRVELAIRMVREAEQIGFRDAKRIVERHICSDPLLFEVWNHRRATRGVNRTGRPPRRRRSPRAP